MLANNYFCSFTFPLFSICVLSLEHSSEWICWCYKSPLLLILLSWNEDEINLQNTLLKQKANRVSWMTRKISTSKNNVNYVKFSFFHIRMYLISKEMTLLLDVTVNSIFKELGLFSKLKLKVMILSFEKSRTLTELNEIHLLIWYLNINGAFFHYFSSLKKQRIHRIKLNPSPNLIFEHKWRILPLFLSFENAGHSQN